MNQEHVQQKTRRKFNGTSSKPWYQNSNVLLCWSSYNIMYIVRATCTTLYWYRPVNWKKFNVVALHKFDFVKQIILCMSCMVSFSRTQHLVLINIYSTNGHTSAARWTHCGTIMEQHDLVKPLDLQRNAIKTPSFQAIWIVVYVITICDFNDLCVLNVIADNNIQCIGIDRSSIYRKQLQEILCAYYYCKTAFVYEL